MELVKVNQEPETGDITPELQEAVKTTQLAEEMAKQAISKNDANKAEIETKVRVLGYNSLEQGIKDIEEKKLELSRKLADAQVEAEAIIKSAKDLKARAEREIAEVATRDANARQRLEKAISLEQSARDLQSNADAWVSFLYNRTKYHDRTITPCRQALDKANILINRWLEVIQDNTKYDFTPLLNTVNGYLTQIDRYLENTKEPIPQGIRDIVAKEDKEIAKFENGDSVGYEKS